MSGDDERLGLSKVLMIQRSQCRSRDNRYVQKVKCMYFRISVTTRATVAPIRHSGGEDELVIMPMVMPIMSKPAMSSVVKDMGESSSMNNPGCT